MNFGAVPRLTVVTSLTGTSAMTSRAHVSDFASEHIVPGSPAVNGWGTSAGGGCDGRSAEAGGGAVDAAAWALSATFSRSSGDVTGPLQAIAASANAIESIAALETVRLSITPSRISQLPTSGRCFRAPKDPEIHRRSEHSRPGRRSDALHAAESGEIHPPLRDT